LRNAVVRETLRLMVVLFVVLEYLHPIGHHLDEEYPNLVDDF
jgi:hypothetical protein